MNPLNDLLTREDRLGRDNVLAFSMIRDAVFVLIIIAVFALGLGIGFTAGLSCPEHSGKVLQGASEKANQKP